MKYARAKRAQILFFIAKYANLWGFCCRRRRGCLSSLKIDCRNAKLHFQMTFSLPSPSCLLKLSINIGTRKPRDSIANVCAFHDFSNTQQYIINQQLKINDQYFIERFIRNCL